MQDVKAETQILIVGAGPSGLALAAELKRRAVDAVIIDQQPEGANTSRLRGSCSDYGGVGTARRDTRLAGRGREGSGLSHP
jgi:2-polyprenyl-6-methoxyphenol hydroxylase-like FAD-dependent oxidoreductase